MTPAEITLRQTAHQIIYRAVKQGTLIRPTLCQRCGKPPHRKYLPLSGHHTDYAKPLAVVWLCYQCHGEVHAEAAA